MNLSASITSPLGISNSTLLQSLLLVLLISLVIAANAGAMNVSSQDWLAPFHTGSASDATEALSGGAYVLWQLRLPRIIFALLTGAALALAGTLTQGLFRNPLAEPGLLGVSSGAACSTALVIVVLGNADIALPAAWRYWCLPAAAFAGAISMCGLLQWIAQRFSGKTLTSNLIATLLLTGIALNALAVAIIGLCTYLASDEQLRTLSFWTLGSLAGSNWWLVLSSGVLLLISIWQAKKLAHHMNALALGDATATHLGIDVRGLKRHAIVLIALLSGFAVAWCGMIGFIGLIAPHIARQLVGPDLRQMMPITLLTGGLLLLLADTLARTLVLPAEIPIGIFTALLGAPFFLILLMQKQH